MKNKLIRMENNRIDRVLIKETLSEIEKATNSMVGVDEINPYRRSFEQKFAEMFSLRSCLAVNSGTDALQLALKACGIGQKDSVIIPNLTYIATGLVVKFVGAQAILTDVKREDLTIDPSLIEDKIKPNTKAIIAVHMFGHPCDMDRLMKIAKKHKIFLIEDACQALGSKYKNRYTGGFGDFAAFSFSYYKPLSSLGGNGGMITGTNNELFKKIETYLNVWKKDRLLEDLDRKFHRMSLTDLASVKIKLKYFDQIVKSKEIATQAYENELRGFKPVQCFPDRQGEESIRENFHILAKDRDLLLKYLNKRGICAELPYTPLNNTDLFRSHDNFSITQNFASNGLQLPLYSLMKKEEVRIVTEDLKKFYK